MQAASTAGVSFSVLVLVAVVSLLVLGGLAYFAFYLNRFRVGSATHVDELLHMWLLQNPRDATLLSSLIEEWFTRRNEFWTSYGQFMLSGFVIAAITILLLTKTISAEAGLPILAGVGGFAIGKTTATRTGGVTGGGTPG
jgi:hypothetical protein